MEEKKMKLEINATDEALKGIYANNVLISHTQGEFVLDFMTIFPPRGILGARVIVSPAHAKRLVKAMQDNISKYEKKFGEIKEAVEPTIQPGEVH